MCEKWDFNQEPVEIDYEGLDQVLGAKADELLGRVASNELISTAQLIELTGPRHIGAHYAADLLARRTISIDTSASA